MINIKIFTTGTHINKKVKNRKYTIKITEC